MPENNDFYNVSDYGDRLKPADSIKIEHSIYLNREKDISHLTALSLERLQAMRGESAAAEQKVFDDLRLAAKAWAPLAAQTRLFDSAIEYVKTPPVKHTENKWEKDDYGYQSISNMVYKMDYRIYEDTKYDRVTQKSLPVAWYLTWDVRTNTPDGRRGEQIAGQDRKRFTDKPSMEKYLDGRIKAYVNLFTEISPPIPQEYVTGFQKNGQLLPGYTVAGQAVERRECEAAAACISAANISAANISAAPCVTAKVSNKPIPTHAAPFALVADNPRDKLKEITNKLEQGIQGIFESEQYKDYLKTLSKFHNYSMNNCLLIAMQKPDASYVAGFTAWKDNFKRNVMKGQKGIKILAPAPFKVKKQMEKIDPDTKRPITGRNGKPIIEEVEITVPAFKVATVFDVSQTEGEPLPQIGADELTGSVDRYKDFFAALEKASPVPIGFENITSGVKGYFSHTDKRIAINEGMSELQTLKTSIHEIAHARLHNIDPASPSNALTETPRPDQHTREIEAESVAYVVCQHYGLDTSDYSFGYVATWSGDKQLDALKASLETIRREAGALITEIDGHLAELRQELTVDSQLTVGSGQLTVKPEQTDSVSKQSTFNYQLSTTTAKPSNDTFTIYQLKRNDDTWDYRFQSLKQLEAIGLVPDPANYYHTYTAPLDNGMTLNKIYRTFNMDRPEDFKGHSLSVSDVVVLNRDGKETAFYVDSKGFQELPGFLSSKEQEKETPASAPAEPPRGENVAAIEAKVKAGEAVNLSDLAGAIKADRQAATAGKPTDAHSSPKLSTFNSQLLTAKSKPERKPSIRQQIAAGREQLAGQKSAPSRAATQNKNAGLGGLTNAEI